MTLRITKVIQTLNIMWIWSYLLYTVSKNFSDSLGKLAGLRRSAAVSCGNWGRRVFILVQDNG